MAIEDHVSAGLDNIEGPEYKRYASRLLRGLILTIAAFTWVGFWGLVVRLHVQLGDILAATVVSVLIVLPAIIGFVYYLRLKLPIP